MVWWQFTNLFVYSHMYFYHHIYLHLHFPFVKIMQVSMLGGNNNYLFSWLKDFAPLLSNFATSEAFETLYRLCSPEHSLTFCTSIRQTCLVSLCLLPVPPVEFHHPVSLVAGFPINKQVHVIAHMAVLEVTANAWIVIHYHCLNLSFFSAILACFLWAARYCLQFLVMGPGLWQ